LTAGDQFGRIISATVKLHRLPLTTQDANITAAAVVAIQW
jgi:hypothetical protein